MGNNRFIIIALISVGNEEVMFSLSHFMLKLCVNDHVYCERLVRDLNTKFHLNKFSTHVVNAEIVDQG